MINSYKWKLKKFGNFYLIYKKMPISLGYISLHYLVGVLPPSSLKVFILASEFFSLFLLYEIKMQLSMDAK